MSALVPSGDAANRDSITYDPAIDRFLIVDGADTVRGDRWVARHFLHNVGFALDTADRLLDRAVAEAQAPRSIASLLDYGLS
jgi:hypothetical protein